MSRILQVAMFLTMTNRFDGELLYSRIEGCASSDAMILNKMTNNRCRETCDQYCDKYRGFYYQNRLYCSTHSAPVRPHVEKLFDENGIFRQQYCNCRARLPDSSRWIKCDELQYLMNIKTDEECDNYCSQFTCYISLRNVRNINSVCLPADISVTQVKVYGSCYKRDKTDKPRSICHCGVPTTLHLQDANRDKLIIDSSLGESSPELIVKPLAKINAPLKTINLKNTPVSPLEYYKSDKYSHSSTSYNNQLANSGTIKYHSHSFYNQTKQFTEKNNNQNANNQNSHRDIDNNNQKNQNRQFENKAHRVIVKPKPFRFKDSIRSVEINVNTATTVQQMKIPADIPNLTKKKNAANKYSNSSYNQMEQFTDKDNNQNAKNQNSHRDNSNNQNSHRDNSNNQNAKNQNSRRDNSNNQNAENQNSHSDNSNNQNANNQNSHRDNSNNQNAKNQNSHRDIDNNNQKNQNRQFENKADRVIVKPKPFRFKDSIRLVEINVNTATTGQQIKIPADIQNLTKTKNAANKYSNSFRNRTKRFTYKDNNQNSHRDRNNNNNQNSHRDNNNNQENKNRHFEKIDEHAIVKPKPFRFKDSIRSVEISVNTTKTAQHMEIPTDSHNLTKIKSAANEYNHTTNPDNKYDHRTAIVIDHKSATNKKATPSQNYNGTSADFRPHQMPRTNFQTLTASYDANPSSSSQTLSSIVTPPQNCNKTSTDFRPRKMPRTELTASPRIENFASLQITSHENSNIVENTNIFENSEFAISSPLIVDYSPNFLPTMDYKEPNSYQFDGSASQGEFDDLMDITQFLNNNELPPVQSILPIDSLSPFRDLSREAFFECANYSDDIWPPKLNQC